MTIYKEVIESLEKVQTPDAHIKSLGKIFNQTKDPILKKKLDLAIRQMQIWHANMKTGRSTAVAVHNPIRSATSGSAATDELIRACKKMLPLQMEEWEVLARRNGWTPPAP